MTHTNMNSTAPEVTAGFLEFLYRQIGIVCIYDEAGKCLYISQEAQVLFLSAKQDSFFGQFQSRTPGRARSLWDATLLSGSVEYIGSIDEQNIKFALLFCPTAGIVILKIIESIGSEAKTPSDDVELATALNQHSAMAILNEQGKVVSANAVFIKIFSPQCNSLGGIAQLIHQDDRAAVAKISKAVVQSLEIRINIGDGFRWFEVDVQPIKEDDRESCCSTIVLRETEVPTLRARVTSLKQDFHFIGENLALIQMQEDGSVIYVSPETERLTGYFSVTFCDTKIDDWIHADDRKTFDAALSGWRSRVQSKPISVRFKIQESWTKLSIVGRWWSEERNFLLIVQPVCGIPLC